MYENAAYHLCISVIMFTNAPLRDKVKLYQRRLLDRAIPLAHKGVSFPGRYGHGKPAKPVNTALSALHSFQSYIISVCF